ncbi:hypothetical protein AGMMS50289_02350 [Betaproteobacteria bacterium]|nr:hypothetical protein AGMMS50289_02350 [Betaproteobacteria bacterium]
MHLSVSATLALLALALVFWIWYPAPLYKAMGVTNIFLLLLGVDVVLGPCLTLAVAKPGKKRHLLLFDLTVIITVQAAAFLYGLNSVAEGRPAWVVLGAGQFSLTSPADLDTRNPEQVAAEYRQSSLTGPQWISALLPADADTETQNELVFDSLAGIEIYQQPRYYRPLSEGFSVIQEKAKPLDDLKKYNPEGEVQEKLAAYPDADAYLPLKGKELFMTVLVKKDENRVIAIVDLQPW